MTNCIHDHARWSAGDQLGAGHLLTAETTLSALGCVKQGKIYDLSHVIEMGAPKIEPVQLPYESLLPQRHKMASNAAELWEQRTTLDPI